ncbi:MAG TPA: transposase, partial [Burkholderiaceae bacterium]
ARLYMGMPHVVRSSAEKILCTNGTVPMACPAPGVHAAGMASPRLTLGRVSIPGQVYAVTTIASARRPLFRAAVNARIVIDALRESDRRRCTSTLAWVVMPDHLHWLFLLRQGTLADCMRGMKASAGKAINRHNGAAGPVWQAGYHDHAIRTEESLHASARYIVHNPVRAGLCQHPADYPHAWCRWPCP